MEQGARKIKMMKYSYIAVCGMGLVYFLAMTYMNKAPDALVTTGIFAALGGGHFSANQANGHEHKKKND